MGPLGTIFSEILIEIPTFSFKKMHLKMSSAKWRLFCLGFNVLKEGLGVTWISLFCQDVTHPCQFQSVRSKLRYAVVHLSTNIPTLTKGLSHYGFGRIIHAVSCICTNIYNRVGICNANKWCNNSGFYHITVYGGTMFKIWQRQHQAIYIYRNHNISKIPANAFLGATYLEVSWNPIRQYHIHILRSVDNFFYNFSYKISNVYGAIST